MIKKKVKLEITSAISKNKVFFFCCNNYIQSGNNLKKCHDKSLPNKQQVYCVHKTDKKPKTVIQLVVKSKKRLIRIFRLKVQND